MWSGIAVVALLFRVESYIMDEIRCVSGPASLVKEVSAESRTQVSRRLRAWDCCLLGSAAVLGVLATSRSFGIHGITLPAAALLGCAVLLALGPLIRLLGGGAPLDAHRTAIIAVIMGCHLIGTLFFFPPEDMLNNRPVLTLDHAVHFYEAERAKRVFPHALTLSTYDPYFMAGYPGGTVFEIDSNGIELWCALLRIIDTARSYKLFIVLAYLLIALSVYAGSRRLGYGSEEAVLAVLVFLAYWHWGKPYAGDFRFAGMFAYLFVCHISFYLVGVFRSFIEGHPARRFYVLGPLAFFIHPTAAVLLPVPFIALLAIVRGHAATGEARRTGKRNLLIRLAVWCALVIVLNAIWLVPFFKYLDIKIPSESFFQIAGLHGLAKVLIKPGNVPALFLMALAAAGFVELARSRRLAEAVPPAVTSVFLLFIAGFGIYLPLFDQMEPGRFIVPSLLFMAPLAGAGLASLVARSAMFLRAPRSVQAVRGAVVIVLLLCSPAFALLASRARQGHTLSTTMTDELGEAVAALRLHTGASGRLMVEDGPAWIYGDSHFASVIPLYTGVEQIGGPYAFAFIKHSFATFQTGRIMGTPLKEMKPERLFEYIDLYNVHWILTATPECAAYVKALGYVRPLWSSRHFALWEVATESTFASERGVTVQASYSLLHVTLPPGGVQSSKEMLLKYHWDRGLVVAPPARIEKTLRLDDPVPLILLKPNGANDIRITFR